MNRPATLRSVTRLAGALVLALCFSGCARERLPAVEESGRSLWQRVETEHFVVESNIPGAPRVRRIASDFETLWHAFASVPLLGLRPPTEKPIVVLFDSAGEYHYFAGSQSAGLFITSTVLGPVILLPPNVGPFRDITVKHELAHFISSQFLKDAPEWLHEGLAQVMETASYDSEKGEVLFGDFLRGRVDDASAPVPAWSFMNEWPAGLTTRERQKHYARSWLLVHYLIDHHLQEFLDFLVRVSTGKAWRAAWADEISLRFDEIDEALRRYHIRARYGLWTVAARLPDRGAFAESTVPAAEAYALRAVLQAWAVHPGRERAQKLEAAQRDLETAFALEPRNQRVLKCTQ